jgi:hypothetical protein
MPAVSFVVPISLVNILGSGSGNRANQARAAGQDIHIDHTFIDVTFEAVIEAPIPVERRPVAALPGPEEG